jgi:hypothetical protein
MNKCSICGGPLGSKHGHNAAPINEGRCCDDCNLLVVHRRLNDLGRPVDLEGLRKLETIAKAFRQKFAERIL